MHDGRKQTINQHKEHDNREKNKRIPVGLDERLKKLRMKSKFLLNYLLRAVTAKLN